MWYEVRAETLVLPGQIIHGWTQRLGMRMRKYTAAAAPTHDYARRPLRPHPGPHLKDTIIHGATKGYPRRTGGVVFSAVGSTAPYAAFVDQGTNGQMAKILPPWDAGLRSHTLYEATWRPKGGAPLGPKPVKGQEARKFFDAGMARTFQYLGNRSVQVPGERDILAPGFPSVQNLGWMGFFGNTSSDPAFVARLNTWRAWRQAAYADNKWQKQRRVDQYAKRAAEREKAEAQRKAEEDHAERLREYAERAAELARKAEARAKATEKAKAAAEARAARNEAIAEARMEAGKYAKELRKKYPGARVVIDDYRNKKGEIVSFTTWRWDPEAGEWVDGVHFYV